VSAAVLAAAGTAAGCADFPPAVERLDAECEEPERACDWAEPSPAWDLAAFVAAAGLCVASGAGVGLGQSVG
jgi:hypothetical protein